jgi:hypothetical protein
MYIPTQEMMTMTSLSKTEGAMLRDEIRKLRIFKHNVDFLIHPLFEAAWLSGHNSTHRTFDDFKKEHLKASGKIRE